MYTNPFCYFGGYFGYRYTRLCFAAKTLVGDAEGEISGWPSTILFIYNRSTASPNLSELTIVTEGETYYKIAKND